MFEAGKMIHWAYKDGHPGIVSLCGANEIYLIWTVNSILPQYLRHLKWRRGRPSNVLVPTYQSELPSVMGAGRVMLELIQKYGGWKLVASVIVELVSAASASVYMANLNSADLLNQSTASEFWWDYLPPPPYLPMRPRTSTRPDIVPKLFTGARTPPSTSDRMCIRGTSCFKVLILLIG